MICGIATILVCFIVAQTSNTRPPSPAVVAPPKPEMRVEAQLDPEIADKLGKVKRVYVDSFGDDAVSKTLQAMVINSLHMSKRFIVTENKDKADAYLRGSAVEKTSQEFHALGEGTAVSGAAGSHSGSVSGHYTEGVGGSVSGSSSGSFAAHAMAAEDSVASTETIDNARLAVRLVSSDGDVLWATTQESKGAKYKGASADVADKIVKQLIRDLEKLEQVQAGSKPI